MFNLWIGVLAGVLFAYLAMRARRRRVDEMWRSWRWWLAGGVAFIVLLPMIWGLARVAAETSDPLDALRTVLLPWAAGVAFGIWIFLAVGPLPASAGQQTAGGSDDTLRRELSFIPIAVALLFVTVMVSDQQYGWLTRLQKLNIGGGSVEFAPRSTARAGGTENNYRSAPQEYSKIDEARVDALIGYMSGFDNIIARDIGYLHEVGYGYDHAELKREFLFARLIIKPLGIHLGRIHGARGYNNLGILIDRAFVDTFRSFAMSQRDSVPGIANEQLSGQRLKLTKEIHDSMVLLWWKVCQTETRLVTLGVIAKTDREDKSCDDDRNAVTSLLYSWFIAANPPSDLLTKPWTEVCRLATGAEAGLASLRRLCDQDRAENLQRNDIILHRRFPYGALLAAMLLFADDEVDSAARELTEWIRDNVKDAQLEPSGGAIARDPKNFYKRFGVYRALAMSATLSQSSDKFNAARTYLLIEQSRKLAEIGETLLTSTSGDAPLSWRTQRERFEKKDGIDPLWIMGVCSNDLSYLFKYMMRAHLATLNNIAFFLSQNTDFAEHAGLMKEMEDRASYLTKKAEVRCLFNERTDADQTQASVFDTAAAVELTLARRKKDRTERNRRLCEAKDHAERAVRLQESTLTEAIGRPTDFNAKADGKTILERWEDQLSQHADSAIWASYRDRLEDVHRQLSEDGMDCN